MSAYTNIREELCPKVYDLILALANPATGRITVAASEVRALMETGRFDERQISVAIKYLIEDEKLELINYHGAQGVEVAVPALLKGNTVTRHIESEGKQPAVVPPPHPVSVGGTLAQKVTEKPGTMLNPQPRKMVPKSRALLDAEDTLRETEDVVGQVMIAFMKTRDALEQLVREVQNDKEAKHTGD